MDVEAADRAVADVESKIEELKIAQTKKMDNLTKDDTSRYSKRATKKLDAYTSMLSEASGLKFEDEKEMENMTPEELD